MCGQHAGPVHHRVVGVAFGAEKPEHGRDRRETDVAVAQAVGVEPFLVEIKPLRQDIADGLVEAGGEQTTDTCLCHDRPVIHADVSAAILAGGQARRLGGQDKSRLVVRGRPIIVRQVTILQRVARSVFVVSPHHDRFADTGLPVHADVVSGAGAIGGLLTALEVAETDLVLVVACDLPFLSEPLLERLIELARPTDAAWVTTARGAEPLLACYQRRVRAAIRGEIEHGRLRVADLDRVLQIATLDGEALAAFGDPAELLANVNTPDDLGRIQ